MQKHRRKADEEVVHDQQHTGNHDYPGQEQGGPERFGGTRAGAENVEEKPPRQRTRPDKRPESKRRDNE